MLPILLSRLKVDTSNGLYEFRLFEFLKDILILISYIELDVLTLNQFHLKLR
jgi:hypothetical protein